MTRSGAGLRTPLSSRLSRPSRPTSCPSAARSRRRFHRAAPRRDGRCLRAPIPSPRMPFLTAHARRRPVLSLLSALPRASLAFSPAKLAALFLVRPSVASRRVSLFLPASLSPPPPPPSCRSTNPSHSRVTVFPPAARLTRPIYVLFLDSFPSGHNFDCDHW